MKVILPVAGKGERMRPYTNNLPKCLLPVGGKTILDWIVEDTRPLKSDETIFITGYLADKVDEFLTKRPQWGNTRTVLQADPQGLGQAISLALPYVNDNEPLLIILGDTLFDADLSSLSNAEANVLYTYKVQDPRRFGVAVTDTTGNITKLIEKPQEFVSDKAIVGIYYIKDVKALRESLQYLMDNNIRTKNEFQLTDALQMMIEKGCKFRTAPVKEWLDCGLPESLIETNTWLLNNRIDTSSLSEAEVNTCEVEESSIINSTIILPCVIGKNCVIENCTVGPNVTIGNHCVIKNTQVKNCVVWDNAILNNRIIEKTVVSE